MADTYMAYSSAEKELQTYVDDVLVEGFSFPTSVGDDVYLKYSAGDSRLGIYGPGDVIVRGYVD